MEKFTKPELLNFLCNELPSEGEGDIINTSSTITQGPSGEFK